MTQPTRSSTRRSPAAPPRRGWAWVAAGVTVLFWASAFVGIRHAAPFFAPGSLALLRIAVGTAVLGVVVVLRRPAWPRERRDWLLIVVAGVLWLGLYSIALNAGEQILDAGTAALLTNLGPLLIALLAGWLLREGFPRLLVVGMAIAFCGAVLVALAHRASGPTPVSGVLLCLVAAATYAAGVVAQKPVLARVDPLPVTFLCCAVGLLTCSPFSGRLVRDLATAPPSAIWTVVYLGAGPTALAFTTWAYALSHTSAGRMGATTYIVPAIVLLLSWLLLDELPPTLAVLGGGLCLVGVAVSRYRKRTAPAAVDPGPPVVPAAGLSPPGS